MASLKTISPQSLQSFAVDIFSPTIIEAARTTKDRVEILTNRWSENTDLNFGEKDIITMYDCYPYMFLEAFPPIPSEKLSDFALASHLFAHSIFFADKIMDLSLQAHQSARYMLQVTALQTEAFSLLNQLFPATSPFWDRFRSYMLNYFHACMREKKFVAGDFAWKDYDENVAWEMATGKSSVSQAVIAGLVSLSGDEKHLELLKKSICLYNFGCQMFDDLCDWKDDYLSQSPSLLLCEILKERPAEPKKEDLTKLALTIYYEGHACKILQLAIDALNQSARLVPATLPWFHLQVKLGERCESLLSDIIKITQTNRRRAAQQGKFQLELPVPHTQCQQIAWLGLQYVVQQWQKGFNEARHVMCFPYSENFTGRSEFQYGDIFQRALIAEILSDAAQAFTLDLRPIITYEANYLIENRCQYGSGGWSYFPDLPELSPDADDLAQVMQVLMLDQRSEALAEYCELPLQTLLTDNYHADGSFETWIIPAHNRTPEQERHAYFAEHAWGVGGDVDVIANVLYTLALYDEARFAQVIASGIAYIEQQQAADGSWVSTWYHGPFYGTYVSIRLLEQVKPASPALKRARAFLLDSQLANGSWGMPGEEGDALNTALALLGCGYLAKSEEPGPDASAILKALSYLQESYQEKERSWPYQEFIRMQLATKVLSYGSRTITTAYVIKATAVWQRLQHRLTTIV